MGDTIARADDELIEFAPEPRSLGTGAIEQRWLRFLLTRLLLPCGARRLLWLDGFDGRRRDVLDSASLILFLARGAEQFGIDGEANLHRLAKDLGGRVAHGSDEGLLQPFLEMTIGYADRQDVIVPAETRIAIEPEIVAWLPDAPSDGLAQRCHQLTFPDWQRTCLPPAAQGQRRVYAKRTAREVVSSWEGKAQDRTTRSRQPYPLMSGVGKRN
jgi:hypothetical protein